jgi:hypothetical protein
LCGALVLATLFFLGFLLALQYVGLSTSIGLALVGSGVFVAFVSAGFLIMGERDEKLRSERALLESYIASLSLGGSRQRIVGPAAAVSKPFACPTCSSPLTVPENLAGCAVQCPLCHGAMMVPAAVWPATMTPVIDVELIQAEDSVLSMLDIMVGVVGTLLLTLGLATVICFFAIETPVEGDKAEDGETAIENTVYS